VVFNTLSYLDAETPRTINKQLCHYEDRKEFRLFFVGTTEVEESHDCGTCLSQEPVGLTHHATKLPSLSMHLSVHVVQQTPLTDHPSKVKQLAASHSS